MNANERILNVMLEAKKADRCGKADCDDACCDFAATIADMNGFADTIPTSAVTFGAEQVPVRKECQCKNCGKIECGGNDECSECGECGSEDLKEAYLIDARCLDLYMEDNDIYDAVEALERIAEHYGYDVQDTVLVAECDSINNGLIKNAKKTGNIGLIRKYDHMLKNCLNAGITCCKKSN